MDGLRKETTRRKAKKEPVKAKKGLAKAKKELVQFREFVLHFVEPKSIIDSIHRPLRGQSYIIVANVGFATLLQQAFAQNAGEKLVEAFIVARCDRIARCRDIAMMYKQVLGSEMAVEH